MQSILNNSPRLSIIIPCHNAQSTLSICLNALFKFKNENDEVILIDDASTDETAQIALRFNLKLIKNETKKGPSYSRNLGMTAANADLCLFIDSDIEITEFDIEKSFSFMQKNPNSMAFTALLSKSHPFKNFFSQYKNHYLHYTFMQVKGNAHFLYGSFCGLRKNIGVTWPNDIRYGEDTWLGNHISQKGMIISLIKEIQVIHHKHYNFIKICKNDFTIPYAFARTFAYNLNKKIFIKDFSHTNPAQLTAITLTALLMFSFFLNVDYLFHLLSVWLIANIKFFIYLFRNNGILFAFKSIPFTLLDQFIMGWGIFFGLAHYSYILSSKQYTKSKEFIAKNS